jgi:hypothetical protein
VLADLLDKIVQIINKIAADYTFKTFNYYQGTISVYEYSKEDLGRLLEACLLCWKNIYKII